MLFPVLLIYHTLPSKIFYITTTPIVGYNNSHSFSQREEEASEGMCHPWRGERLRPHTHGPSGIHERLNCCVKNLRKNVVSQCFIVSCS